MRHLSEDDLEAIAVLLEARIIQLEKRIMSTLADLVTEDAALQDEVTQIITLVQTDNALIAQLQGTIGSGNLNPQDQATVDSLFSQLTAQHDSIVAALSPAPPATNEPAPTPVDTTPPADSAPPAAQ